MGKSNSKDAKEDIDLSSPNLQFMKVNYGEAAVSQVEVWVMKCGFPSTGSFSIRQLIQLREKLEEKEKETADKKGKGKFRADWKAFSLWMEEAQKRDRKTQAGTGKPSSVSQCLKMQDSDLDCAPPRRP